MTLVANSLYRAAQILGDDVAHIEGDRTKGWSQTLDRVLRIASGLGELGLTPGSRVAVLALNGIDYFELSYALLLGGFVMVPLNTRLALPELQQQLADCAAVALVADAAHAKTAAMLQSELPALRHWIGCGGAHADTDLDALALAGAAIEPAPRRPEELATILYTGGTTGRPKGVMLSHASLDHDLSCILADIGWPRGVRYLHVSPMFHLADLGPCWATTALLGSHVWMPRYSIDAMLEQLSRHHCSAVALVPSMIAMMLERLAADPVALTHLSHIGYGAAAIGRPLLERLRRHLPGVCLVQFYGQTEAGGSLTCLRAEDHRADGSKLASVGRPHAACRVRIVAPDGTELPRGAVGEIVGASAGLFMGYLNNPDATATCLRDGWLHTGDAGYMDEDGFVHVTDRLKDMIVTGGENVSSSEVETALMRHPDVALAAVVGRPDRLWGEAVHAAIVPATGTQLTAAMLDAHCRLEIAGFKCPKSYEIRDSLPLSAVGKVRKDLLRQEMQADG